jgi:hypothetical protein
VADLLSGLCWVGWPDKEEREKLFAVCKSEPGPLPLPYAALKPLFTPDVTLKQHHLRLPENLSLAIPRALPNLLAADRTAARHESAAKLWLGNTVRRGSAAIAPE